MRTASSRGARARRGDRRPGWELLTALLALAIAASSALIFTSRVELLKLAVILALWAAVAAAFVSVIYRRQSDVDQARTRDLKLVYDLQLEREISARREYELTVESHLRRELASELRAQAADEVAALRAELAALRTNLEILFDADLGHRPALETERTAVRAYSDWARYDGDGADNEFGAQPSHAAASSAALQPADTAGRTAENPIIDVSEVGVPAGPVPPVPPAPPWLRQSDAEAARGYTEAYRGSHRRAPDGGPTAPTVDWQPVVAEGKWLPPGMPGSNWAPDSRDSGDSGVNSHGTTGTGQPGQPGHRLDRSAVFTEPASGSRHGRHSSPPGPAPGSSGWRFGGGDRAHARHSAESPGYPTGPETIISRVPTTPPPGFPVSSGVARHRSPGPGVDAATGTEGPGPETGGQSVADLLARLQTGSTGGRRRRREE